MASNLVILYGAPLVGKTAVAHAVAGRFPSKSVVVSGDSLTRDAIAVPDTDVKAELDMVHTQLRLLVANYLKNGYNVVVEGVYIFERGGALRSYESDINQMVALMRQMTLRTLVVRLTAPREEIERRARAAGREGEADLAYRIDAAYKGRYGLNAATFDTSAATPEEIAAEALRLVGLET